MTEIECLRCNTKQMYSNNRVKCPTCLFYNDILPEESFDKMIKDSEIYSDSRVPFNDLDPIFFITKDIGEGIKQYAYPPIQKETFEAFQKKSPKRAKSFLSLLNGTELDESEKLRLRKFKSEDPSSKLRKKLTYLKSKKEIVEYLEKTNL
ncbi:MAG: hypothetical protein GF311_21520 [Candidatus Lokiarchaeota archaeon]|nr:hypothetical protein [Candidatus Lokiarchaeota archaeon]